MTASTEKNRKPKASASEKRAYRSEATGRSLAPSEQKPPGSRVAEQRVEYTMKRVEAGVVKARAEAPAAGSFIPQGAAIRRARKHPPATLFERMGRLLDQSLRSESDVVRLVDAGLPAAAFTHLTRALKIDHDLIAPESTIRRRVQDKKRFTTDESERMVRIARVHALASELFGDDDAAQAWLNAPRAYVPGAATVAPYKLAVTDAGARLVEELLLRTAHGVF